MADLFGTESVVGDPAADEERKQQALAGLGGASWLSALPAILGAAASFRNPQAGVALMGMANFLRQSRMEELAGQRLGMAQQREQRMEQLRQQREAATQEHFGKLNFSVPPGTSFQEATAAYNAQRLREHEDQQQQRRDRSAKALSGLTGLESQGPQAQMDPRSVYQAAVGLVQSIGPDQAKDVLPIINRMREQMVRQGQAEQMLPPPRPPEQYGPSQVDPEDARQAAAQYGRGEIQSIPAWLERTGRNPELAGPEGRKHVTEQQESLAKRDTAVSEQGLQAIRQRRMLGLPISYPEARMIGEAGALPAIPDEATRAAMAANVRPWELAYAPPEEQRKGAKTAQDAFSRAEGARGAEHIRMGTPAALARSQGEANIRTAQAVTEFNTLRDPRLQLEADKQRQEANIKRSLPITPEQATHYVHKVELSHPPAGTPISEVEKGGWYVVTPKNFQPRTAAAVSSDLRKMYGLVLSRPDLYPPSTGNTAQDNINVGIAWTRWKMRANNDPDLGVIAGVKADMAQHAKSSGDTANIAIEEQLRQEGGLAMQPMTRERALGSLNTVKNRVSDAWAADGIAPVVLKPEQEEAVAKILDTTKNRDKRRQEVTSPRGVPSAPGGAAGWGTTATPRAR